MKSLMPFVLLTMSILGLHAQKAPEFNGETIQFKASDGVEVTADLYMTDDQKAPLILLFHQAGYSRGEYRSIAPRLNALGYNCLAVDQRSGKEINGVVNETHLNAVKLGKSTEYLDATEDMEAAFIYAKLSISPRKIIMWGSSYSAAILFYLASGHHDNIHGLLAFSPGNYFKINKKSIASYAPRVTCPVFVTSARDEEEQWKPIYKEVRTPKKYFLPNGAGKHGSSALWDDSEEHLAYWEAVEAFLNQL